MKTRDLTISLISYDARRQARVATILMSIIPVLVLSLMGVVTYLPDDFFSFQAKVGVFTFTFILATSGYLIIRKYPENIIKLRQYIRDIAQGTLPERITLLESEASDDIRFIEEGFNAVLEEMRKKISQAEEQLNTEKELRERIEVQQQDLIHAEQHRTMIQSLGAACHHIGQPATTLGMHLYLLKERAGSDEERAEIDECMKDLDLIGEVLKKLRHVSEYRTSSYLSVGADEDREIIDID